MFKTAGLPKASSVNDLIVGILLVGAVAIAVPLLPGAFWLWWVTIPLVCTLALGGIGFVFGVGVDVILFEIYGVFKGVAIDTSRAHRQKLEAKRLQALKRTTGAF
jgi:hypothetical protein